MRKFKKIVVLLLALAMCLGLAACGGASGKESGTPVTPADVSVNPLPAEDHAISSSPSVDAPTFDIDVFEYGELKDIGTDHVPIYPAILCDGTVAMPYGTVGTKEVGYTGEMEEVGSRPQSYSAFWSSDSERRLEDVSISNASGPVLTLNSNIDAAYIFPFDVGQYISAARDKLFQAFKDSLTAYADLIGASSEVYPGLAKTLMELSNSTVYLSGDDIDGNYLDIVLYWIQYLMGVLDINYSDFLDPNLDLVFSDVEEYYTWLSSTMGDHIDGSEDLSAFKRLVKSFDPAVFLIAASRTPNYYIYYDETFKVIVSESSSDGIDYVLYSADFDSIDGFTFGGMALNPADNIVRVFGVPTRANLSWKPDSESQDTANAYLPYVTYFWEYAHVNISMECEPVLSGDMVTLSPSTLHIYCR